MSKKEDLPSINDIVEDTNLPSYKDFIENNEELPSVDEYKTESLEEDNQTIENANGETFAEIIDVVKAPEWQELLTLVNKVREDIPKIPEIKYYDDELGDLSEKITEIQENLSRFDLKSDKIYHLDAKNEEFEVKLNEIESKIPEIPEVRYYEGDIDYIYKKIDLIKEEITNLPEVKYYESDLNTLKTRIEQVNESIPTFPDWVKKVEEVPDFSWIGKTFGVIDDDFKKVQGHLELITEKINLRVSEINETIEVKDFEQRVDLKDLKENYSTTKDKIVKEFKEVALKIYDHHKEFKDDDRKLKKAVLSEQNKLKQILTKEITKINEESIKTDEKIIGFFNSLKENVEQKFSSLPEVKYYDDDIKTLKQDVRFVKVSVKNCLEDIKKISLEIKKTQVELSEGLLNEPPNEKETAGNQTDPLTPLNQKFATLDDLSKHYRLFINRIQTQLSTMGGGGAGFIKDLDDVSFDGTDGQLLIYNSSTSKWVGIASTSLAGSTTLNEVLTKGNISGIGMSVGFITATSAAFSGNVTIGGTITYEDVKNVDSIGIVTARTGINVLAGGINAVGVVTATSFVGDGSGLTGIANTAIINSNQINVSGVVTASSFIGDGSGLSNIISGVGIQSGSVRVGTGFTDVKFTGAGVTIVGSGTTVTVNIPFSTITRQTETSSGVTTNFTITGGYEVGLIDVFLNGIKQRSGVDFTATNGSVVTMTPFISNGDVVEFQKIDQLTIGGITSVTNATNAFTLNSQAASYYLNYNNFSNTPTVPTNNNQLTNGAGFITATSSGTGLTGIVTSIVAGTNVTISGSTGVVTINSSGGGGSSGIEIENNGTSVGTGITSINFSTNVTATASGGIATVTASGGGGGSDGPSSVMMGMIF